MNATTVTEDDLQAFVDERLDEATRERVLRHLAQAPDDARRVEDYRMQRRALRDALRPIADEPVPARLGTKRDGRSVLAFAPRIATPPPGRSRSFARLPFAQAAAIALVCLGVGGSLGWTMAPAPNPWFTGARPLAQEAADSYRTYATADAHAVEMSANDMPALTDWVSSRLGRRVQAPRGADGASLLGGRVVPTSRGPAAMFMYAGGKGGHPAVLLVCPLSLHGHAPMVEGLDAKLTSFTWSEHGMGYSLIADMPAATLRSMAEDMRHSFGRDT